MACDDGQEVFVHRSDLGQSCFQAIIPNGTPRYTLMEGQAVTFEIAAGDRGPKAIRVELAATT
ncbi:cold shock domain-containing protein [Bradyrhizobium sp. Tv2a-2]|uniref:cold-shock protein n=1 Tax=Bradyrhizobium sp. Tv2a-2 TaxID=113395 RepID=UPI000687CDFA